MGKTFKLKLSLLSISLILTSMGAISMLVPSLLKSYPNESTALIESIVTLSTLSTVIFVLLNEKIVEKIGCRRTVLIGLVLAFVGGIGPGVVNNFKLIFVSRIVLGAGLGLCNPLAISMIGYFFKDEKERATLLGYQNAVSGLGLTSLTLIAGILSVYNWRYSFMIYLVLIPVFFLVYFNVPEPVRSGNKEVHKENNISKNKLKITLPVVIMAATIFIFFILYFTMTLKGASLIVQRKLGTTLSAGNILSLRSLATMAGGVLFSRFYKVMKDKTLICAFALGSFACFVLFYAQSILLVGVGMILGGLSSAIIIPYIYMNVGKYAAKGSENISVSMIIVGSNAGMFLCPYIINKIPTFFGKDLTSFPFLFAAISFLVLTIIAIICYPFIVKKGEVSSQNE